MDIELFLNKAYFLQINYARKTSIFSLFWNRIIDVLWSEPLLSLNLYVHFTVHV